MVNYPAQASTIQYYHLVFRKLKDRNLNKITSQPPKNTWSDICYRGVKYLGTKNSENAPWLHSPALIPVFLFFVNLYSIYPYSIYTLHSVPLCQTPPSINLFLNTEAEMLSRLALQSTLIPVVVIYMLEG